MATSNRNNVFKADFGVAINVSNVSQDNVYKGEETYLLSDMWDKDSFTIPTKEKFLDSNIVIYNDKPIIVEQDEDTGTIRFLR